MKIAINQSTIMQAETEEFLEICNKVGIKAVELRIPKLRNTLYRMSYKNFLDILKKNQIKVVGINAHENFSLVPDDNLNLLKTETEFIARMAEMIECPIIICPVAVWYRTKPSLDEIKSRTAERLMLVEQIFSRHNVKVGFEPVGFPEFTIRNLKLAQEIIDKTGLKNITFVPDIYNLFRSGVKAEELGQIHYPISVIHINDTENLPLEQLNVLYNRVFPGDGIANAAVWVKEALKAGYQGYFSLELFRKDIWEMTPYDAGVLCAEKLVKFEKEV